MGPLDKVSQETLKNVGTGSIGEVLITLLNCKGGEDWPSNALKCSWKKLQSDYVRDRASKKGH